MTFSLKEMETSAKKGELVVAFSYIFLKHSSKLITKGWYYVQIDNQQFKISKKMILYPVWSKIKKIKNNHIIPPQLHIYTKIPFLKDYLMTKLTLG
jgi:hypothetical protein